MLDEMWLVTISVKKQLPQGNGVEELLVRNKFFK